MKRLRHYTQLPGDLFYCIDVQRPGTSVFQIEGTAQAKTLRWGGMGQAFNNPKRAVMARACE